MPRYLNELTRLMIIRSVVISKKLLGIGLLIVLKSIKFVWLAFIVNLLLVHHLFSSLNLFMISTVGVFNSEWCMNRAVSSANNLTSFDRLLHIYRHIYVYCKKQWSKYRTLRNSTSYIFSVELTPLITMYWRLSERYDLKKSLTWPRIPYLSNLSNRISWSTVSKALVRSTNMLIQYWPS